MRINYRVLWFEDNASSYSTKKTFVKDIVEDFGFNFVEPRNEVDGTNIENIPYSMYDLIIVDMSLANRSTGIKLIDTIRKKSVFTEVLFYSSKGEKAVREALANYNIDGAYCSGRDNDDFEYKVREVIYTLIKKTQDINNLRGLVMAETSELDKKMEDLLLYFFAQNKSKESESLFDEILKKVEKDYRKNLQRSTTCDKKCMHKIRNKPIEKIINSLDFNSSRKARTLNKLIEHIGFSIKGYDIDTSFYDAYEEDILRTRNLLAHSQSRINDSGTEILVSKTDGNEISFDDEKIKKIRQRILLYEHLLDDLYQTLTTKKSSF